MEKIARTPFSKIAMIGGSAGALEVVLKILPELPEDLSYPVVIILHRRGSDNGLRQLLQVKTKLRVCEVEDKDMLQAGTVFLAPGDYHLLAEPDGTLCLDDSEKVAHSRPSIDVAFQSFAQTFGKAVVGILLSGANTDGTFGLSCIRECGGQTIAQLPETADIPLMPQHAIQQGVVDVSADIEGIVALLTT